MGWWQPASDNSKRPALDKGHPQGGERYARRARVFETHRQGHYGRHRYRDDQREDYLMLRIRHLLIRISTDQGIFGTQQNFHDGLNILRAENYAGKSQVVQSIMYALGMEGMLGPSHTVPLAHALT